MAYIYKITNNLNQKVYIGQTVRTIEERWKEHISEAKKQRAENRPLYRAITKYGIENFSIEKIEECSVEQVGERETYWIEYYHSFKDGYNATRGGDGTPYLDYDLIVSTYRELQNEKQVAERLGVDPGSVRTALRARNEPILSRLDSVRKAVGKVVNQYDKDGNYIQSFPSARAAAESLNRITNTSNGASSHITDVCKGKRKTAYGFIWKFSE